MDRDSNHVFQYLLNELGTSGSKEKTRIMLKGRVPPKRIKEKIVSYVKSFIYKTIFSYDGRGGSFVTRIAFFLILYCV